MKVSKPVVITVIVVLLIAGPSVLRVFLSEYPWQIRFVVTAILVLALSVAIWPSVVRKKEDEKASSSDTEDNTHNKNVDFKQR
jgi:membrane protein implicated in regulation of membrane protease activity